jgi:hypothetical protein
MFRCTRENRFCQRVARVLLFLVDNTFSRLRCLLFLFILRDSIDDELRLRLVFLLPLFFDKMLASRCETTISTTQHHFDCISHIYVDFQIDFVLCWKFLVYWRCAEWEGHSKIVAVLLFCFVCVCFFFFFFLFATWLHFSAFSNHDLIECIHLLIIEHLDDVGWMWMESNGVLSHQQINESTNQFNF